MDARNCRHRSVGRLAQTAGKLSRSPRWRIGASVRRRTGASTHWRTGASAHRCVIAAWFH
ncbi:MAG TPA: hypothetical protein DIW53_12140 [Achromobacter sp.]|nr:hypothetical protein [Achromobacter sp.]